MRLRPLAALIAPLRRVAGALRTTRRTLAVVPDAIEAILELPHLSRQLERIALSTATLPEMHAEIARLRGDTGSLPAMDASLARMCLIVEQVEANTGAVEQLVAVATPLHGAALRVGALADRWPQRRRVSP